MVRGGGETGCLPGAGGGVAAEAGGGGGVGGEGTSEKSKTHVPWADVEDAAVDVEAAAAREEDAAGGGGGTAAAVCVYD